MREVEILERSTDNGDSFFVEAEKGPSLSDTFIVVSDSIDAETFILAADDICSSIARENNDENGEIFLG